MGFFSKLLGNSAARDPYRDGIAHFNQGDLTAAAKSFLEAQSGDNAAAATYALAVCCELADHDDEYEAFVIQAASLGYPAARGECLIEGLGCEPDVAAGVALLRQSAEEGDVVAQGSFAMHHLNGGRVAVDRTVAEVWLRRASSQGNKLLAQVLLSLEQSSGS